MRKVDGEPSPLGAGGSALKGQTHIAPMAKKRPEGAKAHSPGQERSGSCGAVSGTLGYANTKKISPCKGKSI